MTAELHGREPKDRPPLYWEPFGRCSAVVFQLIFWAVVWVAIGFTVGFH